MQREIDANRIRLRGDRLTKYTNRGNGTFLRCFPAAIRRWVGSVKQAIKSLIIQIKFSMGGKVYRSYLATMIMMMMLRAHERYSSINNPKASIDSPPE
jgi:hypothetical protein